MKVTKKAQQAYLKTKLATDKRWAIRALVVVYNNQTEDEKTAEYTKDYNNIGFTGFDGQILTSFANQWLTKQYLSNRQMEIVFKKMPKYWKQVLNVSDTDRLNSLITKESE